MTTAGRWLGWVLGLLCALTLCLVGGPASVALATSPPSITTVSPGVGPSAGGTTVTLSGTGLSQVSAVRFGSRHGTGVRVVSDSELRVVAPPGSGTVAVSVTSPSGTSATTSVARFRYAAAPKVTGLSSRSGSSLGGGTVTITGRNFVGVSAVLFGKTRATNIKVKSDSSVTVTAPKHAAGRVHVRVVTASGKSAKRNKGRFTFVAPPKVTSLSPSAGALAGGKRVTVRGARFTKISQVWFGQSLGTGLRRISSSRLSVKVPSGIAGRVAVTVTGRYGTSPVTSKASF